MDARQAVKVLGAVPIPVGHRIEVTWFERDKEAGLFGRSGPSVERLDSPRVQDLDTGVVYLYGDLAARLHAHSVRHETINTREVGVAEGLRPAEVLVGKVELCQVTIYSNEHSETWLDVLVEAS